MAELRSGYTTGTCAAIATKAALRMIFEQETVEKESVMTPKGVLIETAIEEAEFTENTARCAVRKDAGDDPDATNGTLIFSEVFLTEGQEIVIDGGKGVGRVTKPGLWQKIGEAAINKVPRQMIEAAALEMIEEYGFHGGARVVISVPDGEKIAQRTFNPRLGIVGGISILGTTGIVEPMSEQALIDTIKVEMAVKKANDGERLMIAPGNYGLDFIRESMGLDLNQAVTCSNYVGETLDHAVKLGFKKVLMIGHIGKFVKLAAGIMNTHSRNADGRMEIMASCAALETDDIGTVRKILKCLTTDDAIRILKESDILEPVMKRIVDKALFYVNHRAGDELTIGIIMFSNEHGLLGVSENAEELVEEYREIFGIDTGTILK